MHYDTVFNYMITYQTTEMMVLTEWEDIQYFFFNPIVHVALWQAYSAHIQTLS